MFDRIKPKHFHQFCIFVSHPSTKFTSNLPLSQASDGGQLGSLSLLPGAAREFDRQSTAEAPSVGVPGGFSLPRPGQGHLVEVLKRGSLEKLVFVEGEGKYQEILLAVK